MQGMQGKTGPLIYIIIYFRASLLDYRQTLNLFDYIHNETDYIPWSAASSGISYLGSLFSKTSKAGRNYPVCSSSFSFIVLVFIYSPRIYL